MCNRKTIPFENDDALKACFDDAMSRRHTSEWHSLLKHAHISVKDFESSTRPSSKQTEENVEKVRQATHKDRQRKTCDVFIIMGLSRRTSWRILKGLNTRLKAATFVSHLLNDNQKKPIFCV